MLHESKGLNSPCLQLRANPASVARMECNGIRGMDVMMKEGLHRYLIKIGLSGYNPDYAALHPGYNL